MSKLDSKEPVGASDIRKFVAENDDFGFEMYVGSILRTHATSYRMDHGSAFTDPITGKVRQFDYRLNMRFRYRRAFLAVECKHLQRKYPMIVCSRNRSILETRHQIVVARPEHDRGSVLDAPNGAFYHPDRPEGKNVLRFGRTTNSDGDIYERWAQSLSSAHDCVIEAMACPRGADRRYFSVVLPVLVVPEGTLWIVKYSDDGSRTNEPEQIDSCEYSVRHVVRLAGDRPSFTLSHVHFCTTIGLAKLLDAFNPTIGDAWEQLIPESEITRYLP